MPVSGANVEKLAEKGRKSRIKFKAFNFVAKTELRREFFRFGEWRTKIEGMED
jgi:hypothetical protein